MEFMTPRPRSSVLVLPVAAAGAAIAQRWHLRAISSDPAARLLDLPPGRAVPVRSADGTVLHAEVFGREDAPTIVFSHGWVEALRLWVHLIRALSDEFRIVAFDHRAHGSSGRAPTGDYSTAALAEDLDAVLRACVPAD